MHATQLYSKNGGVPQKLPESDSDPTGSMWSDLPNNPEGRAACGWVEASCPASVSRMQLRLALLEAELLDDVEAAIAASNDRAAQIYWADASDFWRTHPMTLQFIEVLGKTEAEADALFIRAKAII
ncbi:hypothetical protein [Caulobacter sp. BP25]|uniref:hypothetical protein n=1 Tax=Caulobacter sp. BP25 TaxID=2048900 RepID=UPI000C129B8B|nr:hypothetical protein [Caulobacter sp. BP25]PHY20824.1 hypothetical protein CSW59_06260 [Caulobacter sp. BP25]